MEKVKSFLEEGYDFIEESCSTEPLEFTEVEDYTLSESEGTGSKYKVLGVCKGVFQPINEPSRNGRIYESNHWNLQLNKPEVQERIKSRSMWGTLGHFDRRITDADIREGLVSHIISKLEIHEDMSGKPFLYGELEILDTPAGRILEAMYKGGANLYVSSRGAGKLLSVVGDTMKHVDPNSFWFEGFDIVRAPGFLKARPVYESAVSEDKKQAVHESHEEFLQPSTTSEELTTLKSQIDKLAKIVEKVVDDVYEPTSEGKEEPVKEVSIEEQLGNLLMDDSVSESAFEDTVAILKESNPELVEKIMENSRKKFNDENRDKSGLEIEYYRFAGKHPYKIVPKGTDYFAASHDSPTYRTLKQAQKHILDTYNKVDKTEAFKDFAALMASTNISEEAFEEIIDIIVNSKKEVK